MWPRRWVQSPSNVRSLTRMTQAEHYWTQTRMAHQPPPRAPPALNPQVGLWKPPLQGPRHWSLGQGTQTGASSSRCHRHRHCCHCESIWVCWGCHLCHEKAWVRLDRRHKRPPQWARADAGSRWRRHHRERVCPRANAGQSGRRKGSHRRHHEKPRATLGHRHKKPRYGSGAGITSCRERARPRANTGHRGHCARHCERACWLRTKARRWS